MSTLKMLLACITLLSISACALFDPFVDRRREPGTMDKEKLYVGSSTPSEPAICYNSAITSMEEVQKLADEECVKHQTGDRAMLVDNTVLTCRVLLPNHAHFKCVKD